MLKDCIKVQEKKKRAGHVVVQRRQRNAQKACKVVVLLIKPIACLPFSLPSP